MPGRKINILKIPVYALVKNLAVYSFRIFFREKVILNPEHLKITKPTIIISNHPSTLIDPLQVGIEIKEYIHFLINAGMVEHWFTYWFFNTFFCIPISRSKGEGGEKVDNAKSFAKANQFLSEGGVFFVAPEGVSKMERRLHPIKTGVARIALSAEAENNFELDVQIQAFGLNYTNPRLFRSSLVMDCGAPFSIKKYQEAYEQDPQNTVRELTKEIGEHMRELIIDTADEGEDQLLRELGRMQQAEEPLALEGQFIRSKKTLKKIQHLRKTEEEGFVDLQNRSSQLAQQLTAKETDQDALNALGKASLAKKNSSKGFRLLWEWPFFIYGWLNNFLPNYLPGLLAQKMKLYKGYDSTVKVLSGIVLYPLLYGMQTYLVQHFFGQWWITLIYLLSLYPMGIVAWNYRQRFLKWKKEQQMIKWKNKQAEEVQALVKEQQALLAKVN